MTLLLRQVTQDAESPTDPEDSPQAPAGAAGTAGRTAEPRVSELEHAGARWLNIEEPTAVETAWLAEHFEFHELDLEDVLSTRQRPKIDEYDEYLFMVLHLPRFDKSIGRLNAAELNIFIGPDYVITLPNHPLKPVGRLFTRLRTATSCVRSTSRRAPATCSTRSCRSRSTTASRSWTRSGSSSTACRTRSGRSAARTWPATSRTSKQEIIAFRKIIKPERTTLRLLERARTRYLSGGSRGLLRRHRRLLRADLGPARQLQRGRRGARADQRVGDRAPAERHPARAHGVQRDHAAADPDLGHLRHERAESRTRPHSTRSGRSSRRWSRSPP